MEQGRGRWKQRGSRCEAGNARWLHAARQHEFGAWGADPSIYNALPYDPIKDFIPVAGLIRIPVMLFVHRVFPNNSADEFA